MQKCVGGSAPQSQCKPKTPETTNCSRRRRKVHNSKEACSSLTLIADARVTKKKVYRVKSRRESWCKESKTGDGIYSNTFKRTQEGGVTDLAGTFNVKSFTSHEAPGNSKFQPHRAEACRKPRLIPHTCRDKQLLRCQLG